MSKKPWAASCAAHEALPSSPVSFLLADKVLLGERRLHSQGHIPNLGTPQDKALSSALPSLGVGSNKTLQILVLDLVPQLAIHHPAGHGANGVDCLLQPFVSELIAWQNGEGQVLKPYGAHRHSRAL